MSNRHRLIAHLSESTVIGTLMHNMDWVYLPEVSLKQDDFASLDHQVLYSIIRERLLENNKEISAEQIFIEAEKHPMKNKHSISLEMCKSYKQLVGEVSKETFIKEVGRLNKLKILRELDAKNYDLIKFIGVDSINAPKITEIIDKYSIDEIINSYRKELDEISESVELTTSSVSISAGDDIEELVERMQVSPEVGSLFDGSLYTSITRGAIFGKYHLNSAPTGVGKSRMMVGNAAKIGLPSINKDGSILYKQEGYGRVLFITTELEPKEIQQALLACVSGVSEDDIKNSNITSEQLLKVRTAAKIIKKYEGSFFIEQISNPSVATVRAKIDTHVRRNNIEYVFFDYIFESSNLISEFSRARSDVALMYLSDALKELATTHQIFMSSATQVNGDWLVAPYRGANLIRGSKAIIDKIDVGGISLNVFPEEYKKIEPIVQELGCKEPNMVTDIYKNRGGTFTDIKIFRHFDKDTCRMEDLFMTNLAYEMVVPKKEYNELTFTSNEIIFVERSEE